MNKWTHLVIDVDYRPCDPGMNNWYCETTECPREILRVGKSVHYDDPGHQLAGITVMEMTDEKLVLKCAGKTFTLEEGHSNYRLDEKGYNYTIFLLHVYLKFEKDDE